MAINAFTGGPGTGKTYGVIEHVLLPALLKGRSVLTNIEGLNIEGIYQYVHDIAPSDKIVCIGSIRVCRREAPDDASFFPGLDSLDKPSPYPSFDCSVVSPGDLVVIDEASRYWPVGQKVKTQHSLFFREHRHFANQFGDTCDLVIIDPDISLIVRALKGKIEMTSFTHKLKELGSSRYVVRLFRGFKTTGKPVQTLGPYSFKEKIFTLYKSYSHEKAKEQSIDTRQNVLNNKVVWVFAFLALLFIGGGLSYLFYFFSPSSHNLKTTTDSVPSPSQFSNLPSPSPHTSPSSAGGLTPDYSSQYRIAGRVHVDGVLWVVLVDSSGSVRLESPSVFSSPGSPVSVGVVDGKRVASWTGQKKEQAPSLIGGTK